MRTYFVVVYFSLSLDCFESESESDLNGDGIQNKQHQQQHQSTHFSKILSIVGFEMGRARRKQQQQKQTIDRKKCTMQMYY